MSETVKLTRKRASEYVVNYNNGIKTLQYKWAGTKNGKEFTLPVPREVFDYLNMNTKAIRTGALVVADSQPNKEEIVNEIIDVEEYQVNSHSRDEIIALLKGNINKMKKELSLITSRQEKMFVKQIKDELVTGEGLNNTKSEFIDEWVKLKPEDTE